MLQNMNTDFEKEITKLTIDNDIMKIQLKELQEEKTIEKSKSKNIDLLKDIFPETYENIIEK